MTSIKISPHSGKEYLAVSIQDNSWNAASEYTSIYSIAADSDEGYIYVNESNLIQKIGTGRLGTIKGKVYKTVNTNQFVSGLNNNRSFFYDWEEQEVILKANYSNTPIGRFNKNLEYLGLLNPPSGISLDSLWRDRVIPDCYYGLNSNGANPIFYHMRREGNNLIVVKSLSSGIRQGGYGGEAVNGIQYIGEYSSSMQVWDYQPELNKISFLYSNKPNSTGSSPMGLSFSSTDGSTYMYIGNHSTITELTYPNISLFDANYTKRLIAYSDDGINFSEFKSISLGIPQARYLKFKLEMFGNNSEEKNVVLQFDANDPQSAIELNEFLVRIGTDIKPVTLYNYIIDERVGHENEVGFVISKEIDRSIYKQIMQMQIRE